MTYDIPDEIRYKEKIVFNLDFKQLLYACVFGLLAFFSFNLPLQGNFKLIAPIFFLIVGLSFVFLNLEEKVFDAYGFYSGVRKAGSADAKAQKLVGVKRISGDVVFLNGGGMRAVLQVEPLNFALLDEGQRKAVVMNYREFLNHLTESVQVLVKTSKPDLTDYFAEAQKRLKTSSKQLSELFDDFMVFEQGFLVEHDVRERNFYLVVSHFPSNALFSKVLGNEAGELQVLGQRSKIIQEKLGACGLKSKRLGNDDLNALFAQYSSREAESSEVENDEKVEKTGS